MSGMNDRLSKLRIYSGKTQSEMAAIIGVSQSTYQRYESDGSKRIPYEKIEVIYSTLDTEQVGPYTQHWLKTGELAADRVIVSGGNNEGSGVISLAEFDALRDQLNAARGESAALSKVVDKMLLHQNTVLGRVETALQACARIGLPPVPGGTQQNSYVHSHSHRGSKKDE